MCLWCIGKLFYFVLHEKIFFPFDVGCFFALSPQLLDHECRGFFSSSSDKFSASEQLRPLQKESLYTYIIEDSSTNKGTSYRTTLSFRVLVQVMSRIIIPGEKPYLQIRLTTLMLLQTQNLVKINLKVLKMTLFLCSGT